MKARAQRVFAFLRKHQRKVVVGCVVAAGAVVLFLVFGWSTGFGARTSTQTTITRTYSDGVETTVTETTARGKTLWDWLDLLIVPAVLAGGAVVFNQQASKREEASRTESIEKERLEREERYEEGALQRYFDAISELLLEHELCEVLEKWESQDATSPPPVIDVAQARTVSILSRVNQKRRLDVVGFLKTAGLLTETGSILIHADMSGINLNRFELFGANLRGTTFIKTNLNEAKLFQINFENAHLLSANLSFTKLHGSNLRKACLNWANLREATLDNVNMKEAILENADLTGASLINTELVRANLQAANLSGACMFRVDLSEANLFDAKLRGAKIGQSDFSGAILDWVDLAGADLMGSILKGSILKGANFAGATVTPAQLREAKSLEGAIMPDGRKYEPGMLDGLDEWPKEGA